MVDDRQWLFHRLEFYFSPFPYRSLVAGMVLPFYIWFFMVLFKLAIWHPVFMSLKCLDHQRQGTMFYEKLRVFEVVPAWKRYLAIITSIVFSLGYGSVSLWDSVFHSQVWKKVKAGKHRKVLAPTKLVKYDSMYLSNIITFNIFVLFTRITTGRF